MLQNIKIGCDFCEILDFRVEWSRGGVEVE